jgi:hypothetical protein
VDHMTLTENIKQRLVVLTDISNEPDDEQSLVRLLMYATDVDIEGLVATTSVHLKGTVRPELIRRQLEAYQEILPNLRKHHDEYPDADALLSLVGAGPTGQGTAGVGDEMSTDGSDLVIAAVDRDDPRPVWVTLWGGANCLAQALWTVRQTRSESEVAAFVDKIRVYAISDQDDAAMWIRETFPGLYYVVSPKPYSLSTWYGVKGVGDVPGADDSKIELSSLRSPRKEQLTGLIDPDHPGTQWVIEHIRTGHGPLGELYPETKYAMEGDTPSYLGLLRNGLNFFEDPKYGGWGGRYELYQPENLNQKFYDRRYPDFGYKGETRPIWTDVDDTYVGADGKIYTDNRGSVARWRDAFQDDFAARMDWGITERFADVNHNPVAAFRGQVGRETIHLDAAPGDVVELSADGSTDPDGDALSFKWFQYREAGTFDADVAIESADSSEGRCVLPSDGRGDIHVILEVSDDGPHVMRAYRRVVIHVE